MVAKAPFTLTKIKRGNHFSFYVMYRDPETGTRLTKKSIDKLKGLIGEGNSHVSRKDEAIIIAQKVLDKGLIFQNKTNILLQDYLLTFFDWDKSSYFTRRRMLDAISVSPDYVTTRRNLIKNHLIPLIPSGYKVGQVTTPFLEKLQEALVEKATLSHSTINLIMGALSQSLEDAKKQSILPLTVATRVDNLSKNNRIRGILNQEESQKLLTYLSTLKDQRAYLSCTLSLLTGMRSGELRALTTNQIHQSVIIVDAAYADKAGRKLPKGKKMRTVPCPETLCQELIYLAKTNPHLESENPLVFWSKKTGKHVSSHYFSALMHRALIQAEILTEQEIEQRNISFHSLRHMANTLLRGSVDEYILRLTIGHSSESLSDIYTHMSDSALLSVRIAQKTNILPFLDEKNRKSDDNISSSS